MDNYKNNIIKELFVYSNHFGSNYNAFLKLSIAASTSVSVICT